MSSPSEPERTGPRRDLRVLTLGVLTLIVLLAYSGRLLGLETSTGGAAIGAGVAFPAAFVGGLLALLSPCTGVVLPAFFAYSYKSSGNLLRQTYVFFLGLALVFVPLGFASSILASLLLDHAGIVYVAGGALLVALGVVTLFGGDLGALWHRLTGRDLSSVGQGLVQRETDETGRSLMLGVIFGLTTSSCTAPIIGAMATLAVGAGFAGLHAMLLFLVFALGIATPLFLLAALFERYDLGRSKLLRARPRTLRIFGRSFTILPHHAITGAFLIALGIVFVTTRGTTGLVGAFERWGATDLYVAWTEAARAFFAQWPPAVNLGVMALVLGALGCAALRWARPAADSPEGGRGR